MSKADDASNNNSDGIVEMQKSVLRHWAEQEANLLDWWREAGATKFGVGPDDVEAQAWALLDPIGRRIALAGARAEAAKDPFFDYGRDPYGTAFEYSYYVPTAHDAYLPTVTPAEACAIANHAVAAIDKHWDSVIRSFCRPEAERVIRRADRTVESFVLFQNRGLDETCVRDDLEIVAALIIELIAKLQDAGGSPLIETLESLVRQIIGWPWKSDNAGA
jgi:hypothetical protein